MRLDTQYFLCCVASFAGGSVVVLFERIIGVNRMEAVGKLSFFQQAAEEAMNESIDESMNSIL